MFSASKVEISKHHIFKHSPGPGWSIQFSGLHCEGQKNKVKPTISSPKKTGHIVEKWGGKELQYICYSLCFRKESVQRCYVKNRASNDLISLPLRSEAVWSL